MITEIGPLRDHVAASEGADWSRSRQLRAAETILLAVEAGDARRLPATASYLAYLRETWRRVCDVEQAFPRVN